ncbi:hypothetical protein ACP4OV_000843 [Aristida adscensionis]
MEVLLLPPRAATARPLLPTSPLGRTGARTARRPAASSSSNVEVIEATATSAPGAAKKRQEWRAAGGLGLDLSDEMRRGMMWLLDRTDAPSWAAAAGSAVLFVVGLLGVHYGFLSSRWDAEETGSVVGWDLTVQHWRALSMAKDSSSEVVEVEDDDDDGEDEEDEEDDENYYYEEEDED